MLRLMCITAHPDDESGGFGGTLRTYAERGVETFVLCLTPGQAAGHRGTAKNDQELAALRRKEFADACEILHVTRGAVLDYPDGQLYRQDLYRVVCEVTRYIREFRPQVLMCFGPEGAVTAHPDHSMSSIFATLAFHWSGRTNRYPDQLSEGLNAVRVQKLYYATADFYLPDRQPVVMAPATTAIDISKYYETKIQAFRAHTTQAPLFRLFESNIARRGQQELFHLAARADLGPIERETDLFAGVKEE
ncbi:MAG TPA: PIG-L family deacetylase [Terriglobales bacterium]|nr:PIG-L family deacetylase [Terriglobales bacterium]